jgi:hypothetical protein
VSDLTRVTINLTRRGIDALDRVVERTGDSRTDSINRALQAYDLLLDLVDADGGRGFTTLRPDGTRERVTFL